MNHLKMDSLSKNILDAREMKALVGGATCGCGCSGSSSTNANGFANHSGGKHSSGNVEEQTWFLDPVEVVGNRR